MKSNKPFTNLQLTTLVVLRIFIGWHLLFEGFSKLLNPGWSSARFLRESQWIMSGFSNWVTSNAGVLNVVDFLNTWGLIAIGAGLILGLFARTASVFGAILLFLYFLNNPPLTGLEYSLPSEGNYLIINKTLIEAVTLFALAIFPTSQIVGFDLFLNRIIKRKKQEERK
ncbi:DoxX family membrane protein [Mariniphaga sediminis]|uniref:DoxX family membrane protein n=1 Tax=Mariniphaga sediminis TaxID=1628158 RepID=A0A399D0M6_9BACT|nr:DoxX family membrane protein [Mariniphaga sediminis]RIH63920.1 DoxX family membrane protein [Mariniphaga sediminis]